ncbi:MAG: glycosyltransferase family 4 protein [Sulfuricurvum sp.]|jgi:glycosyltransferase involved in cell wall biosynthesis
MKVALVINIPAPYRIPIFEKLSEYLGNNFLVIFAARTEPNRTWNIKELKFNHLFLNENITEKKDGFNYVHNNPDIWKHLKDFNPDVIITTGFNPTHLYAWLFAKLFRKKHLTMTDGTIETEEHLSWLHKLIRKIVFSTSHAFIGAGQQSLALYQSYGIPSRAIFQSHLCAGNERFKNQKSFYERNYDLMFSGQFTERKLPFFFAEIAKKVSHIRPNIRVLILGSGPLKEEFLKQLVDDHIEYTYPGFVSQEELPSYYCDAKLFLFTTRLDPWGVVANEALASGTPVLVTPHAGIANDLVKNDDNGYILNTDSALWATQILATLDNPEQWQKLSTNAVKSVNSYTYENAAMGILNACSYAYTNTKE